jgi:hypothetical protein
MNSSTSWCFSSRKNSVIASPASATRRRAPRLVHLSVDERDLRGAEVCLVDDARLRHLVVQVVALARPFTNAGENRNASVELGNVVDQLHDHDGLAHAGAAERADLPALEERTNKVDHFNAR